MNIQELYKQKYLKYKKKYLEAKQTAGKPIVKEDLRPKGNQLIGLVTDTSHPWYEVTTNHASYKIKLRPGVSRKIKKNGTEKFYPIIKGETYVILEPEVCNFGKDNCGDIKKIYSDKEKEWLLLNETLLLSEQFLTESLYRRERNLQDGRQNIEFVHSKSQPRERTIRPGGKEFPPSESEEDEDDQHMREVVMNHPSAVLDVSSDNEFFSKPEQKPKQKHQSHDVSQRLDLQEDFRRRLNPDPKHPEKSGAADATHKWGQPRDAESTRPWAQHRAVNASRPSAASRWDQPHAADTRDWAKVRGQRDEPEPGSD